MAQNTEERRTKKLNLLPYKFKDLFDYGQIVTIYDSPNLEKNIIKDDLGNEPKYIKEFYSILHSLPHIPDSKTLIGIEIEVERCPSFGLSAWTTHKEGSLRNNGKEFVSFPLEPRVTNLELAAIYAMFKNIKGIDFSWRTSTHVHLDLRSATLEQLIRILLVYAIFEKLLFIHVGERRDKSIFCVPLTESWLTNGISKFISGDFSIGGLQEEWEKYSAFNLFRLKDYGTVEFRHMGGTPDPSRISTWIALLVSIYNAGVNMATDELISVIENINTTSRFEEFKEQVFGKKLSKVLAVPHTKLIEQGVTFCKECLSKAYYPLRVEENSALFMALKAQKKSEPSGPERVSIKFDKKHLDWGGEAPKKVIKPQGWKAANKFADVLFNPVNLVAPVDVFVNPAPQVEQGPGIGMEGLKMFLEAQKQQMILQQQQEAAAQAQVENDFNDEA